MLDYLNFLNMSNYLFTLVFQGKSKNEFSCCVTKDEISILVSI